MCLLSLSLEQELQRLTLPMCCKMKIMLITTRSMVGLFELISEIFMQKYVLNTLIVFFLFSLVGCQSNQASSNIFSSFTPLATPGANLAQTVQEALMRNDDLAVSQVHVQTRQDVVVLTGYVKKIRLSDTAEQIARQVPGVRAVENHIIIRQ